MQPILKPNNVPTEPGWYWFTEHENSLNKVIVYVDYSSRSGKKALHFVYQCAWHNVTDVLSWLWSDRLPDAIELPPKPRVGVYHHEGKWNYAFQVALHAECVRTGQTLSHNSVIWYDEPTHVDANPQSPENGDG